MQQFGKRWMASGVLAAFIRLVRVFGLSMGPLLLFNYPCAFAQVTYEFQKIDLGVLGTVGCCAVLRINDKGQIVGAFADAVYAVHGFIYGGGRLTTIDVPFANTRNTQLTGINNSGQIVGSYTDVSTGLGHGFSYDGASFSKIDVTSLSCPGVPAVMSAQPLGISNNGQIVGVFGVWPALCSVDRRVWSSSFLYNGGSFTDLNPGGVYDLVNAYGINNSAQIVGVFNPLVPCNPGGLPECGGGTHGFLGAPGSVFEVPGSSGSTLPFGINDNGDVVGTYYNLRKGKNQGFVYRGGQFNDFDLPADWGATFPYPVPYAINNLGQIVGVYHDGSFPGATHVFLATPKKKCDGNLQVDAIGANINAVFYPKDNLTLPQLAQQCGFVGFNWMQKITHQNDPSEFYALNLLGAFDPYIVGPVNLSSARVPWNDPPEGGGYTYQNGGGFPFPFYYDAYCNRAGTACPGLGAAGTELESKILSNTYLTFHDAPSDGCLPGGTAAGTSTCLFRVEPQGSFGGYKTDLVGIRADRTFEVLGLGWTWISNYNGTTGGVHIKKTDLPADGNGTGGITITSINGVPETLASVICTASPNTLWPPNGKAVLVSVSGMVTAGTQTIPSNGMTYAVTDEYGQVQPSGSFALGSGGAYSFGVPLIAARDGNDRDGRTYTINVTATDQIGNRGSCSAVVTVPHDQGN